MALSLLSKGRRLLDVRSLIVGSWLQNQMSTSESLLMSQTSETPSSQSSKIYEMRTYYVKPKAFGKGKENSKLTF